MNSHPSQLDSAASLFDDKLAFRMWPKSAILWIAAVYMAMFVIRPWELLVPELGEMHFERLMVIGITLLTACFAGIGLRLNALTITAILMVAVICLGSTFAQNFELAKPEIVELFGTLISFIVLYKVIKTPYQLMFMITSYVVITSAYLFKCEYEYLFHGSYIRDMGVTRLVGIDSTFGHPNEVASTAMYFLPFLALLWLTRAEFTSRWPKLVRNVFPVYLIACLAAAVVAVILTGSRAGMIGIAFFGVLLTMRTRNLAKKVQYSFVGLIIGLLIFLALPEEKRDRLQSTWDQSIEEKNAQFSGTNESAEGRWLGFVAGIKMFQEYPIHGVGMGNFAAYRKNAWNDTALDAHNTVGELLGETGITGFVMFVAFVGLFFWQCRSIGKLAKRAPDNRMLALYGQIQLACRDGGLLLLYKSLSSHNFQRYNWMWFAAFAMVAFQFAKQEFASHQALEASADWDDDELEDEMIEGEFEVVHG